MCKVFRRRFLWQKKPCSLLQGCEKILLLQALRRVAANPMPSTPMPIRSRVAGSGTVL